MSRKFVPAAIACVALLAGSSDGVTAGMEDRPSASAQKKKADLKVVAVAGIPKNAAPGAKVKVRVKVRNIGRARARGSRITLFLSAGKKTGNAERPNGNKRVPALKPGKSATVRVPTRLKGQNGAWRVIACASKAKKESRQANNCRWSRKFTLGSSDPFPKRFVGEFTVSQEVTEEHENAVKDQTRYEKSKRTMTGELELTRVAGSAGVPGTGGKPYTYVSSGQLEYAGTYTSAYSLGQDYTESCNGGGSGVAPIVPYAGTDTNGSWARIIYPLGSNLSPGSTYTTPSDAMGYPGFVLECSNSETGLTTQPWAISVQGLLPQSDDGCNIKSSFYTVRPDGSLVGKDSCDLDETHKTADNVNRHIRKVTWSWDLKPEG